MLLNSISSALFGKFLAVSCTANVHVRSPDEDVGGTNNLRNNAVGYSVVKFYLTLIIDIRLLTYKGITIIIPIVFEKIWYNVNLITEKNYGFQT